MPAVVFAVLGALLRAPLRPPSATLTPSCSSKRCSTPTSVATAEAPGSVSTSWLQEELQLTDEQLKLLAAKLPSLDTPQLWVTMPSGARVRRESTVEENILRKANQKRLLDSVVVQAGNFNTDFFKGDNLKELFGSDAPPAKVQRVGDGAGGTGGGKTAPPPAAAPPAAPQLPPYPGAPAHLQSAGP